MKKILLKILEGIAIAGMVVFLGFLFLIEILMKIAIITDQHFGCRKNSKHFHDYFLKFYNDTFFPYFRKRRYNNHS